MSTGESGVPGVEIGRVLGRGASSTVYLATQLRFGRKVAVKVIDVAGRDEVAAKLFRTECRTLGRLTGHPDIVTVFDGGVTAAGRPYLVMDYLPGGTLADRLRERGPLDVAEALSIGVRLAGALETAHRHGIIHGDVKPQNVLRSPAGDPALADFGIARLTAAGTASSRLQVLTPLHAAPELLDGHAPTVRTDVYALASTLFEVLDGRPATGDDTDSPLAVIARIARQERRSLDRTVVPEDLADAIDAALSFDPDLRPATMADFGEQLRAVERAHGAEPTRMVVIDELPAVDDEEGDGPYEGSADRPTIPPPRERRRRALAVAVAVLLAVVAASAVVLANRDGGTVATGADASTTTSAGTAGGPSTTTTAPAIGVQPDVTYNVRDAVDATPDLADRLADTDAIFAPLGSHPTLLPSNALELARTPATLRYQAWNPARPPGCRGFLSRPVTVTGVWGTLAKPNGNSLVSISVVKLAKPAQADEGFVAFSLGQGPAAGDCTGFGEDFTVENYDDLDVRHQDVELPGLPDGVRYNVWVHAAGPEFPQYDFGIAGVAQKDRTLVLFGIVTTKDIGPPDVRATSQVVANVLNRI